jgi:hypothetical protein
MDSPPFATWQTLALSTPNAFPAIEYRLAWLEFRALFGSLINEPVWNASPSTVAEWEASVVSPQRFETINKHLPENERIDLLVLDQDLSLPEAFGLLERYHSIIRSGLHRHIGPGQTRSVATLRDVPAPLPHTFSRQHAVAALQQALRAPPPAIHASLLHGSLADGLIAEGFSDADVLCVINSPDQGAETFWSAARWLFSLNHHLYAINPSMHHGPMLAFADEVGSAAEASLPSAVVSNGVWLHGRIDEITYHDGLYESIAALAIFEPYFERQHLFVPDIHHAFDLLWWTSNALILPVLLHQVETGVSMYKRDCLVGMPPGSLAGFKNTIDQLSQIRINLGRWIAERQGADEKIAQETNPGAILVKFRKLQKLPPTEVRTLGCTDSLISSVQDLWSTVKTRALSLGHERIGANKPARTVEFRWSRPITREPRRLGIADYDKTRAAFLQRCADESCVRAVFEFGEIGCPGLSDMDFCVVLDDDYVGTPSQLCVASFPEEIAYVMDHDPLFVSVSMCAELGAVFPIFSARQILGLPTQLPPTDTFPVAVQAGCITHKNLRKYPGDLDWLISQERLNLRTMLAFLHSATHIAKCLKTLSLPVPSEILRAMQLDNAIRSRFSSGHSVTTAEIFSAITACMTACEPMRRQLVNYWLATAKRLQASSSESWPTSFEAAIQWTRLELSLNNSRATQGISLAPVISEYLARKRQFVAFEGARNRTPNVYIEDPTVHDFKGN